MTLAMVLGMVVFGVLIGVVAGAAGSSLDAIRIDQPELFVLGMAFSMTVPMVAWMSHRGHTRRRSAEMTAAMFAPALALIVCYWLNGLAAGSVCPLACAAMVPAMIVAMLYRLDVYTAHHVNQESDQRAFVYTQPRDLLGRALSTLKAKTAEK